MIDVENFLKNLEERDRLHREILKIDNEIYIFENGLKIQLREYCKKFEIFIFSSIIYIVILLFF